MEIGEYPLAYGENKYICFSQHSYTPIYFSVEHYRPYKKQPKTRCCMISI